MKHLLLRVLSLNLLFYPFAVLGQSGFAEGYFTSEANSYPTESGILVSIKKYNPTKDEIYNASKPSKKSPMNYLMAPFEATDISMYDNGFESMLYSLDRQGRVLWNHSVGFSNRSTPSPLKVYKGFIFTGESTKKEGKITIQKIDIAGNVVWQTELDSLNNVNDIYVDEKRVSALVSFNASKRIEYTDGTFSEHIYPIYFFVQFDILTGKLIVKDYQKMANYLSSINFSNPFINTDYSYFLNNKDSAIFLNTAKLESATVVSQEMGKENTIVKLTAGNESYHLLTLLSDGKSKRRYILISDFYGKGKKYESELPLEYTNLDRSFIIKTGDSIITIVGNSRSINIVHTNFEGKSSIYKRIEAIISPIISTGAISGQTYILQMDGRIKPGTIGKIKLDYY